MKQSTAEGVMIFNDQDQVVLINTVVNQLLGYDHDELAGMTIGKLMPGKVSKNNQQGRPGMPGSANQPNTASIPSAGIKKQGTAFPVEISLHHFNGGDKTLTPAVFVVYPPQKRKRGESLPPPSTLFFFSDEGEIQL